MKPIYLTTIAPIIRGLCINTSGQPWVVIHGSGAGTIPPESLVIDIGAAITENQTFDEDAAAKIFREAHTAWEFEIAPAGVEAMVQTKTVMKEPSCVVVKTQDTVNGFYWIDRDIDAARKRMQERNASFLEQPLPLINQPNPPNMNAASRTEVVRNKVALVTGGAEGLGAEIAHSLAASGGLVYVADICQEEAERRAALINAGEKRTAAIPLQVSMSDEGSVEAMFQAVAETTGGLDLCICGAETIRSGSMLEQELDDFKLITNINYTGFFLMTKYAGLLLRGQHRTAPNWKTDIIQINSRLGLQGEAKNSADSGGKFGALGLIASFALELIEYNIKVNAVCPGAFSFEPRIPMKRGCTGMDVMRALYYIIEQEYETGQALPVTGGTVMLH
jgi:sorbitol-6-phosphate 2-dehydrogenase